MKEILKFANMRLIKKYDNFYIRFIGGQYIELPCDIKITELEAESIIDNCESIVNVFDNYRRKVPWTMKEFIQSGLEDYLNKENYSKEERVWIISRLDKFENIKYEMYESIMEEEFPIGGMVQVHGKTAKFISEESGLSIGDAYLALLELAEQE